MDNYLLSKATTLQIGGPAKKFVNVSSREELIEAIKYAKKQNMPFLVIGGGSNLLVADEGVNSLVIKNEITGISQDNQVLTVKSGSLLQDIVDYSIHQGLSGLQKLTGIPGTIGGAVYGNAGAYGQTISNHLTKILALNANNLRLKEFNNSECAFNYRNSIFKRNNYIVLEVTFFLKPGNPQALKTQAEEIIAKRLVKYPKGIKCPGSFFKNIIASTLPTEVLRKIPQDKIVYGKIPAGALLEIVGAPGQCSDGIKITSYHANLFINQGKGSAQAFYNLAKTYALKVREKFDITLEPEVQLINLPKL